MSLWFEHSDSNGQRELYRVRHLVADRHSRIQRILVMDLETLGLTLAIDGHFQITESSVGPYHEFLAELATRVAQSGERIVICGGGDGVAAAEILRRGPNLRVTVVDHDEAVVDVARSHLRAWNRGVIDINAPTCVEIEDALQFLRKAADSTYRAIVVDAVPPHSTTEHILWSDAAVSMYRSRLTAGGVLVALGEHSGFENRFNEELLERLQRYFAAAEGFVVPDTGSVLFRAGSQPLEPHSEAAHPEDAASAHQVESLLRLGRQLAQRRGW